MNDDSPRDKRIRGSATASVGDVTAAVTEAPPSSGELAASPARHVLPLRRRLREATSSAILDATEEVLAEGGFAAASLQAIAARAGIAVGTIYNHFRDRDELLRALFTSRCAQIFAAVDAALDARAHAPFADQLRAFVGTVFEQFDAHRAFFRIAVEIEHLRAQCPSAKRSERPMNDLWERCERVVRSGLEQNALCAEGDDLYPAILAGIMRGVLIGCTGKATERFSDETDRVVSIFLHGAARRISPPPTPSAAPN
jgi:AcrR family transcriptional regulator